MRPGAAAIMPMTSCKASPAPCRVRRVSKPSGGTGCPTNGYAGYNRLIQPDRAGPAIRLACCWAPARRKLFEVARNSTAPIAKDGLKRIAGLYKI